MPQYTLRDIEMLMGSFLLGSKLFKAACGHYGFSCENPEHLSTSVSEEFVKHLLQAYALLGFHEYFSVASLKKESSATKKFAEKCFYKRSAQILQAMKFDFKDLPLYVSSDVGAYREVSAWRLKIGK